MTPNKPIKSFKKLSLSKDTIQPPTAQPQSDGARASGAQAASEYCSGSSACSIFYAC